MKLEYRKLRWIALSTTLAALAGCAVMRVDVDVYKGPLANTERVQMEQLATMAIGAKPLLIELRDKSEWSRYRRLGNRNSLRKWSGNAYQEDYMPGYRFEDPYANRINSVLSLYKDGDDLELTELIDRIADHQKDYKESSGFFRPSGDKANLAQQTANTIALGVYSEIRQGLQIPKDHPSLPQFGTPTKKTQKKTKAKRKGKKKTKPSKKAPEVAIAHHSEFSAALAELWLAYDDILTRVQQRRVARTPTGQFDLWPAGRVFVADASLRELRKKLPANQIPLRIDSNEKALRSIFEDLAPEVAGSNAHFVALSRHDIVESHAELLFRNAKSKEAIMFVNTINKIAESFLSMRQAKHEALIGMLHFIEHFDSYHYQDHTHRAPVLEEAAEFVVLLTDDQWLSRVMAMAANGYPEWRIPIEIQNLPTSRRGSLQAALISNLTGAFKTPSQTASALIKVDRFLRRTDGKKLAKSWPHIHEAVAMTSSTKRRFGLSKVVNTRKTAQNHSIAETRALIEIRRSVDSGLRDGRLETGLESLINDYLRLASEHAVRDEEFRRSKERLMDASIHFAEKLLFLANNHALINPGTDDTIGVVDGAIGAANRGLLGGYPEAALNKLPFGTFITGDFNRLQENYVRLLQAVGNYIMIQVDELRQVDTHSDKLKATRPAELQALKHSLDAPPGQVFGRLAESLRAESRAADSAATKAKAALAAAEKTGTTKASELTEAEKKEASAKKAFDEAATAKTKLVSETAALVAANETVSQEEGETLRAAIVNPGDRTEVQVVQGILDWLDDQIRPIASVNLKDPRPARLVNTRIYFRDYKAKADRSKNATIESLYDRIVKVVQENHEAVAQKIETADDEIKNAKKALTDASELKKTAEKAKQQSDAAIAKAKSASDTANSKKEKADHSLASILALKTRLLAAVNAATPPSAVYDELKKMLKADMAEAAADAAQPLKDALAALNARNAPMDPLRLDGEVVEDKEKNARDVLDAMIAALRYQHVQALRSEGEDSAAAKNIETAIKAAYNQRSNLIHIRPPAAYLRSSFPSTSLQADPGLRWKNMLQEQAMRSAPLFTSLRDIINPKGKQDARINAEIDKQFWQNINSVRVAGGGNVNYVVAKDDIGNWYVKTYEADPTNIINSAKNLALFSAGSAAGLDLMKQKTTGQPSEKGATTLERLLTKHRVVYDEKTVADLKETVAALGDEGVRAKIPDGWKPLHDEDGDKQRVIEEVKKELAKAHTSVSTEPLDEELKKLNKLLADAEKAAKGKNPVNSDAGRGIPASLQEVRRYHGAVMKAIDSLKYIEEARKAFLQEETKNVASQDELNKLIEMQSAATDAEEAQKAIDRQRKAKEEQQIKVDAAKLKLDTADAAFKQAKANITRIVRSAIRRIVESREESVDNYEQSILFIGEAAKG